MNKDVKDLHSTIQLVLDLINSMAVIVVLAYVLTRCEFYNEILENKFSVKNRVWLVVIFGVFSIYGTLRGIDMMGAIANIRDLGPTIAGLVGGPVVGLGAGLIGGIYRYSLGGFTVAACSLSPILAGLIGGWIYRFRKGKFVGVSTAILLSVGIELLHFALALLFSHPFSRAWVLVQKVIVPMIIANGLGMGIFAFMIVNLLKERETEAAKRLIEGELQVARQIQQSIVPHIFPAFPERPEFEVHAVLEPAKEVGGDFYDFFFTDDDHLFFVVGDVSGKGVPASLFMAVTRTLLRSTAERDMGPDEILGRVNNELCRDNDTGMFVTVFCGILDIHTGEVVYSCGGHDSPFVHHPDGRVEELPPAKAPVLGAMEDIVYECKSYMLQGKDRVIIYTDGVSEAMNLEEEFWGKEGLANSLRNIKEIAACDITNKVLDDVRLFAADALQYDDITILALTYFGY